MTTKKDNTMQKEIRIDYDDMASTIIETINQVLKNEKIDLHFKSDNKEHDGYEVYTYTSKQE